LLLEHFFAQGQHAKRDELAVEIFAQRKKSGEMRCPQRAGKNKSGTEFLAPAIHQPKLTGAFGASHRLQDRSIHLSTQVSARWKNSYNAPAAARIGQAEIATMITKNSASMTNSKLFSLVK
jgi:hypothetical protein